MSDGNFILDTVDYSFEDLMGAAAQTPTIKLAERASAAIRRGQGIVDAAASSEDLMYGINTGFGSLCTTKVLGSKQSELQRNLLLSHACGVGGYATATVSRLTLLLKLINFRSGYTGISLELVHHLVKFWNCGIIPAIPERGTVGASGDLAPLAHMSLPLLGLGYAWKGDQLISGEEALRWLEMPPANLLPKEGLALTNGVQFINARGLSAAARAQRLVGVSEIILSLSLQGFSAAHCYFDEAVHATSRHKQRQACAQNLRLLLSGSNCGALPSSHPAREDPYSFRCSPQTIGAARQAVSFAKRVLVDEANSISDNPLVFYSPDRILTCGNLHGQSTSMTLDFLAIALMYCANGSERRSYQLLSGQNGLPPFLVREGGVNSGFMVAQYTAAALVNESKIYATPSSVDTIMTCQLQEDHVSMAGSAATKLDHLIGNLEIILAIELLLAAQAVDLVEGLVKSVKTTNLHKAFREKVPFLQHDVLVADLIKESLEFVRTSTAIDSLLDELIGVDARETSCDEPI